MSKIRLVTDSTSDIPLSIRQALDIEVVPLKVHFGEETYLDGITIQSEQFYEKLASSTSLPTTSQPSPVDFLEVYKRLASEPETTIISVHLSSALSGTYQSALLAKSLLEDKINISIIDSKSASYGSGILVTAAAEAAKQGKSKDECLQLIHTMRKTTKIYFLVDTLEYLQKGGRIGKASALFGSLLNIKPILTIDDDGEVAAVDKIRGHKKAMMRIIELLKREFGDKEVGATIAHANSLETAEVLHDLVQENFLVKDISYTSIGPVIGTHVGAGALAVFMHSV